jgi:hypothetical protein
MEKRELDQETKKEKRYLPLWLRNTSIVLLVMITLLFSINILSNNSQVQKWYSSKISEYLSSKTGYPIQMGVADANLWRGLVIHDVNILDLQNNEMIKVAELETSLRKNVFSLIFNNKINLNFIEIIDAEVLIKTYEGEKLSNLEQFIRSFSNSDQQSECRKLDIKKLVLKNAHLTVANESAIQMETNIGQARVLFNKIDLCNRHLDIREIFLSNSLFAYDNQKRSVKTNSTNKTTDSTGIDTFHIVLHHLLLDGGQINLKNLTNGNGLNEKGRLDFSDLQMFDLDLEARSVNFNTALQGELQLDHVSLEERSGFKLNRLSVENIKFDRQNTRLTGVSLSTPGSAIQNNLSLSYNGFDSFKNFKNRVFMEIQLRDSDLLPSDIFYFVSALSKNEFFRDNYDELIHINGRVTGRLNNLKGKDISITLKDDSYLEGDFNSRNLLVPGEQLMNIRLKEFVSNTRTLSKLLPGIAFNDSFLSLGELRFKGAFDGYFHDFVAYGTLGTDLGNMKMDMRLNLSKGASSAEYSGNLSMQSFDLGRFADNKDLGNISFNAKILNGQGLNINTVSANLKAVVDSLEFKGHSYENLVMEGYLDKNLFNGDFAIEEELIDIDLSGIINYGNSPPVFDFEADIQHLDLYKLNLVTNPLLISSNMNINISGSSLEDIQGKVKANNLVLNNNQKKITLDSVLISSRINQDKERYMDVSSEIASFYFDGKYQLNKLPDAIIDVLKGSFPELMEKVPYIDSTAGNPAFYYDFYAYIPDSRSLFEIIQPLPANIEEMVVSGHVNHSNAFFDINSSIKSFELADIKITNFTASIDLDKEKGTVQLEGENLYYQGNASDSLFFNAQISQDDISYNFRLDTLNNKLKAIDFAGVTRAHPKGYENNILTGSLHFVDDIWYVKNGNSVVIGPKYIDFEDFSLVNNQYAVTLEDYNENQGLKTIISGLDLSIVNAFWVNDFLQFSGASEGFLLFPSIFENKYFEGAIRVKEMMVNNDPYGELSTLLQFNTNNRSILTLNGSIENGTHAVKVTGGLNLAEKLIDLNIDIEKFPAVFLEYIVKEGITNTSGYASGKLRINGPFKNLDINGEAMVFNGQTMIDYLGTNYFFDQQKIMLTKNKIDFTGAIIKDREGNTASVTGGIYHQQFNDLEIDVNIRSPRIIALTTTKTMNPLFYGNGIGSVNARFTGPISSADISVDAEVFQGSHLTIPVSYQTEVSESSFIKFNEDISEKTTPLRVKNEEIAGVNLDMNLSILQGSEVKIVLDEVAGDNIQGTGTGDIRIEITRTGGFEMYGNFYIDRGTYLFTALTLIQKPFSIREGGKITWTGDPLDARIDLFADYKGERVALDNFIKEYTLSNPALAQQARKRTDVDLLLHLTGSLLQPEVSFDLNFPNLEGDIKSYVYSKLQKLRSDQNLMYTQAITLLSLGTFLPHDNLSGFGSNESSVSPQATTIQVGLQYTAVVLSKYLSGLLEELFTNSSWISGVDIDINAINSQVIGDLEQNNYMPNEYTYDAKLHLFDDKASIEFNGSYVNRGIIDPNTSYANGDIIFRYFVTEDRKLRIEAYSKREYEEYFNEWKWKIGLGLNYQMKFGSIYDMKNDIEKDIKALESSENQ